MSRAFFTEAELKAAVYAYGEAWRTSDPSADPGHVFSEIYKSRKAGILSAARKRQAKQRVWHNVAAVFIVLIMSFGIVLAASPTARAAVLNWTVDTYNRIVDYRFYHNEDDHTFLICDPGSLPEGFVRTEEYHKGYYARKVYADPDTGSYIKLEYRKPTDAQIKRLEKQAASAELFLEDGIIKKYITQSGSKNKLFWYDPQRNLVFRVESNLDRTALEECFRTMDFRLPLYEPTWLPEGFEISERIDHYMEEFILYEDPKTQAVLFFTYTDMAEANDLYIFKVAGEYPDEIRSEAVTVSGGSAYYYPSTDNDVGADLVWIDEIDHIVFVISGTAGKETMIRIAESVCCTETKW